MASLGCHLCPSRSTVTRGLAATSPVPRRHTAAPSIGANNVAMPLPSGRRHSTVPPLTTLLLPHKPCHRLSSSLLGSAPPHALCRRCCMHATTPPRTLPLLSPDRRPCRGAHVTEPSPCTMSAPRNRQAIVVAATSHCQVVPLMLPPLGRSGPHRSTTSWPRRAHNSASASSTRSNDLSCTISCVNGTLMR